ncbi:MAG: hypothetical protein ACO1N7_13065 [Sphingobacteriaceae bacterium]
MKKKKASNVKFYCVILLFIFVVSVVELIKNTLATKTYSQILDLSQDSPALLALPVFSITIVLFLTFPKKNL